MTRRRLSEEEEKLWQQVMQNAQPLQGRQLFVEEEERPAVPLPQARTKPPRRDIPYISADLTCGFYAGIDRNTAEKFRKGEYPMDGELDLHGMSREKAHQALSRFLHSHYQRESRCLLVVTGKGVRKSMQEEPGRGILREMLPGWLAEPGLRPLILAFEVAKQKHGGSGAFYVLLRRQR